jgi:hypothetical protein
MSYIISEKVTNKKKFWEELIAQFPLMRHGPYGKGIILGHTDSLLPRYDVGTYRHTDSKVIS